MFHFMLKFYSFFIDLEFIIFCTANIVEYGRLKLFLICIYWSFGCLNDTTTSTNSILPQYLWERLPPIRKPLLFLSSLSFHSLLFIYIFISASLLFLLHSAGTVWALLGTWRWSHPINNAECFYGNCLATMVRGNCLLCGRGERHQDDTETGNGIEREVEHTLSFNGFYFNFKIIVIKDKCDIVYLIDLSNILFV